MVFPTKRGIQSRRKKDWGPGLRVRRRDAQQKGGKKSAPELELTRRTLRLGTGEKKTTTTEGEKDTHFLEGWHREREKEGPIRGENCLG